MYKINIRYKNGSQLQVTSSDFPCMSRIDRKIYISLGDAAMTLPKDDVYRINIVDKNDS